MYLDTDRIERIAASLYECWGRGEDDRKEGLNWAKLPEHRKEAYRLWVRGTVLQRVRQKTIEIQLIFCDTFCKE